MSELNDRMKDYEKCYSFTIPKRSYVVIRVDGRGFSKFTKSMEKPFDDTFSDAMDYATLELCKSLSPSFAYTQSDEITLVFANIGENESPLFGNKVQKLCSISAGIATKSFNKKMTMEWASDYEDSKDLANDIISGELICDVEFDSRVFVIPDIKEVANCIVWRQRDASKNSISMAADALFSHKELQGKSSSDKQDMMISKGVNWNDYRVKYKRGVIAKKVEYNKLTTLPHTGEEVYTKRSKWIIDNNTPILSKDWDYLYDLIPKRK